MSECLSMSGYGRGEAETSLVHATVELRSVNHRFLDIQFKLPRAWLPLESELASKVRSRLGRGRVEVMVRREATSGAGVSVRLDLPFARDLQQAATELGDELRLDGALSVVDLLRTPGVLGTEELPVDLEAEAGPLHEALEQALEALVSMRSREGARLQADLEERLQAVEELSDRIQAQASGVAARLQEQISERVSVLLAEVDVQLDGSRIAQEVALLADRSAIDEELTRLRSHLVEARSLVGADEPVGRQLEFLSQEMNREANTIGSKSGSSPSIPGEVVKLKAEIEKLREQAANIE